MTKQAKPTTLEDIRARIDATDTELLRLLDQRAQISAEVAAAKAAMGQGNKFALRPARESQVMRRLLSLPRQAASKGLVSRVWREIIGESLYSQTPFHIAAWGGKIPARVTEVARQRFGQAPALIMVDDPDQAISTAKATNGVAVLAMDRNSYWWAKLLLDPTMTVFAVLPDLTAWGTPSALAVAEVALEPSGEGDETLWVTDSAKPSYEIEIAFSQDGVAARLLSEAGGMKLFALSGFYMRNDERLARAPGRLTGVIGVAPAPFDL
jgi:chorismate mutase